VTAPAPLRAEAVVESNAADGPANWRLRLRVEGWPDARPGQFVMLQPGARGSAQRFDPLLPRPMAVYRTERAGGSAIIEVLYKVVGRGTALLADLGSGDRIGLVGPLGQGFPEPSGGRAVLVGGGTGIASLYELAARWCETGQVTVLLGARTADDLMGETDFRALGADLKLATEDGSAGARGRVTELLGPELAAAPAQVYACGPNPMMQRAAEIAEDAGARCWVSLENRMACGFGVCLGCAVPRSGEGFDLVCRDGPVFESRSLRWEGLP